MLEQATEYILALLTQNPDLQKLPGEFVSESVQWIKSWIFKPADDKTNAKLEDPDKSVEVKKDIIQDKLEELKDNEQFQKELMERLTAFEQHKAKLKNVISGANIDATGNVRIGDEDNTSSDNYDEKNVIKDSTIKAGGDFSLGDKKA